MQYPELHERLVGIEGNIAGQPALLIIQASDRAFATI